MLEMIWFVGDMVIPKKRFSSLKRICQNYFQEITQKTYCKFYVHKYWTNVNDSCPPRMPSHWHTRISQNTHMCKSLSISVSISSEIARFSAFSVLKIRKTSAAVMTLSYPKCTWNAACGRRARNLTAGAIYSGRAHRAGGEALPSIQASRVKLTVHLWCFPQFELNCNYMYTKDPAPSFIGTVIPGGHPLRFDVV